jgi:hypothetical protein
MAKVVYTGYFVNDTEELLRRVPIVLTGDTVKVYAHHLTKEFHPSDGVRGIDIGVVKTLYAYGQVITDQIQTVLIRDDELEPLSANRFPHITLATSDNTQPSRSNDAIEKAVTDNTITTFSEPVPILVTEGYFDGSEVRIR